MKTKHVFFAGLLALASSLVHAGGKPIDPPPSGYLCCNLRSDGSWISDSNYFESGKSIIAFGTPVKGLTYGRSRVQVEIAGRKQALGNDYSDAVPLAEFAARYIVSEDPRVRFASYPPQIQKAITKARVMVGMTREQVLMAVSYPIADENPDLGSKVWKYWLSSDWQFDVHFDDQGKVSEVKADPNIEGLVLQE